MRTVAALLFLFTCLESFESSSATPVCTNGFTLINNKCLKLLNTPVNHKAAEISCSSFGATLVTVKNDHDNQAIATIVGSSTPLVWLGLYCFSSNSSQCLWDDESGSARSYNNFSSGFPLVALGQCVYYSTQGALTGKWLSAECESQRMAFVCELPTTFADNCLHNYNGYCYTFSSSPQTFIGAQSTCAQTCGNLASVHSPNENRYITTFAPQDYYYIGAIWKTDYSLRWMDGSAWDYNNIDPIYPNRYNYCLHMSTITTSGSGFWYGDDCSLSRKYVCKREAGVPCTTVPPPVTVRPSSTNPSNCNAGLLMSPGVFTSPNYPQNYFNNENCTYQLSTLGSYRITLKFSNFRTESNYDFVSVYDGPTTSSPSLGRYSGNIGSFYVSSSENNMLVTFTSDAGVVFQGFTARFYSVVHRS
ncbi:C-type LECtin [Caenorhabditis elegans]|uniref:C-type LECtin n=1 Tax=Caenorhabditis elegans TaxID=6239 RepID=O17705_CAEEL|nr:C-type LECtin [Caenorhabditis elegans]CAB05461.1 C-type LECtin [Caenorhabditis elegans]|eukprot:NP_493162.1 C-type LECtin [Caenorhabditis elegans]